MLNTSGSRPLEKALFSSHDRQAAARKGAAWSRSLHSSSRGTGQRASMRKADSMRTCRVPHIGGGAAQSSMRLRM
jgi:hypothetical protein